MPRTISYSGQNFVVPDDEIDGLLPRLQGGEPKKILISNRAGSYGKRYFLLARQPSS